MAAKKKTVKKIEVELTEKEKADRAREKLMARSYQDRQGRWRFKEGDGLVSRKIAHSEVYSVNREKYPLEFNNYVVYHKDKNRGNFDASNLFLVPWKKHMLRSSRLRVRHRKTKLAPAVMALGFLLFFAVIIFPLWLWIAKFYVLGEMVMATGFFILTLITLLIVMLYSTKQS